MESTYRKYFDALPCYLTVQDREFRLIDANDRFRRDFGDWEGRYCYQVYKHRSEKCEICPVERVFHDGQSHRHVAPSGGAVEEEQHLQNGAHHDYHTGHL